MKFVIRDDDLNYFSQPEDVRRWYDDIFAQGLFVGFSTVPFVKADSDIYTGEEVIGAQEYSIGQNQSLVQYLKGNKQIEILQHGCYHENINGQYEYAQAQDLSELTAKGKSELEAVFGFKIKIFVPPHDWISRSGILAIERCGLQVIRGRGAGLRNLIWRWAYLKNFIKMLFFRFPNYISSQARVYPYVLDFGKHKEMCSYRLEDEDIFQGLEFVRKHKGVFVVVCHLHSFNEEKKKRLDNLIAEAKAGGASFVCPSDIFKN